jgi:type IX secretion system PorP/SprF family membrane protein
LRQLTGILFLLLLNKAIFSQQRPQYTQYIFNNFLLNPAVAGIENYTDVKAGYRNQWKGLEGAPVTTYISVNTPLGNDYLFGNANSFPEAGTNPLSRSYRQHYAAAEPHHGVGLSAVIDKEGPFSCP